jgi:hypothetical protein
VGIVRLHRQIAGFTDYVGPLFFSDWLILASF